jgi:predicted O-methyltransferase YrrM
MMIAIHETLKKFPFLSKFDQEQKQIENIFSDLYDSYMHKEKISTAKMSMFLKTAAFLYFFSKHLSPKVIFDMGSGFSTVVFNLFASNHDCKVYTTDTSDEWLIKTKKFISDYCKRTHVKYVKWDNLSDLLNTVKSDMVFYDLYGKDGTREKMYKTLVANQPKSLYLLDDMHRINYVKTFAKIDHENNRSIYSLEDITKDETTIRYMAISYFT